MPRFYAPIANMMKHRATSWPKFLAIFGVAMAVVAMPTAAQAPGLAMLDKLTKGEWTIKSRDGAIDRRICIKDGRELIQLRHTGPTCNRFVIDDDASQITVQYTCPGNGYGRTTIRRETADLVQVQSQGIVGDLPFQFQAEARRTGSCR